MLTYIKYGSGPTVWLAFHGIGQDATCFAPFGERLARTHTLYSIDLPFHGQRTPDDWPPVITQSHWQRLLADFLAAHRIDRFSVVGFSMGGRFALITAQQFAPHLNELLLLAPDGITDDYWYRLGTSTRPGRATLRFLLKHTPFLLTLGRGLVRLGLLSAARLRFVEATTKNPAQRDQIYLSWTGFTTFRTELIPLAKLLRQQQVRVRLFLGQFDAVLPRSRTRPLETALPSCEVTVLPTGHLSLVRRVAAQL